MYKEFSFKLLDIFFKSWKDGISQTKEHKPKYEVLRYVFISADDEILQYQIFTIYQGDSLELPS